MPLPRSIIEFYYKKDELNDPMVAEEHITAFNWASTQEIDDIMALTRASTTICSACSAVGIKLIDFKIEFGRLYEGDMVRTVVADEISPDSCRLWDVQTNEKMDKDRFRRDLGNVTEAYVECAPARHRRCRRRRERTFREAIGDRQFGTGIARRADLPTCRPASPEGGLNES
ncbi:MAG: phosphoribosylaminoimidazolesuccinocarboxamide synthase [Hyphomonadaceae bacterium]